MNEDEDLQRVIRAWPLFSFDTQNLIIELCSKVEKILDRPEKKL